MVFHCGSDLDFHLWLTILRIFSCDYWSFVCYLWRKVYLRTPHIFKLNLSFCCWATSSFHILDMRPLSFIYDTNTHIYIYLWCMCVCTHDMQIFHSVCCLFTLVHDVFWCTECATFMKSNLSFSFLTLDFSV